MTQRMRVVAKRLLDFEANRATRDGKPNMAALILVCEKLRVRVSTYAGKEGFLSLMRRSLVLAKEEADELKIYDIDEEGSLQCLDGVCRSSQYEASVVLVARLLEMLAKYIGETLTLQLLEEEWRSLPGLGEESL